MTVNWRCLGCGECCKHLVGRGFGMALLPGERQRLNFYAHKYGINFETKPLVSGIIGCRLYQVTQEKCPFLRNNKCLVYDARPLVCQMFPLHPNGLMRCTFLDRATKFAGISFPEELKMAAMKYATTVQSLIQQAEIFYSLDDGWKLKDRFPELRVSVT